MGPPAMQRGRDSKDGGVASEVAAKWAGVPVIRQGEILLGVVVHCQVDDRARSGTTTPPLST